MLVEFECIIVQCNSLYILVTLAKHDYYNVNSVEPTQSATLQTTPSNGELHLYTIIIIISPKKHNVGMVQCVSKYACSCVKTQLVNKLHKQGGAFLDIATRIQFPQVDICISVTARSTFAPMKTHFGYTFTILTFGNLLMRLDSVYRSALLPSKLT